MPNFMTYSRASRRAVDLGLRENMEDKTHNCWHIHSNAISFWHTWLLWDI